MTIRGSTFRPLACVRLQVSAIYGQNIRLLQKFTVLHLCLSHVKDSSSPEDVGCCMLACCSRSVGQARQEV